MSRVRISSLAPVTPRPSAAASPLHGQDRDGSQAGRRESDLPIPGCSRRPGIRPFQSRRFRQPPSSSRIRQVPEPILPIEQSVHDGECSDRFRQPAVFAIGPDLVGPVLPDAFPEFVRRRNGHRGTADSCPTRIRETRRASSGRHVRHPFDCLRNNPDDRTGSAQDDTASCGNPGKDGPLHSPDRISGFRSSRLDVHNRDRGSFDPLPELRVFPELPEFLTSPFHHPASCRSGNREAGIGHGPLREFRRSSPPRRSRWSEIPMTSGTPCRQRPRNSTIATGPQSSSRTHGNGEGMLAGNYRSALPSVICVVYENKAEQGLDIRLGADRDQGVSGVRVPEPERQSG